ncbi:MAG: hypothetical protein K2N73_15185 [Lachnospiraceae bacterium]|nr:hypothetical protein [Lachnospiraceae bacterium]
MVYIFTAMYCEAHIFIRQFNLIKNQECTWYQEFYNETADIRLAVTGVGEIAAATVVSSVCSIYRPTQNDLLFNIGICAHTTTSDGVFLCNKIIEKATGKTFYPDMLYRHNFNEGTIVTGMLSWIADHDDTQMTVSITTGNLYDMEAAAVYQAGIHFFGPHQMIFLKIVSDKGVLEEVSKEQISLLMEKYQQCIFDYIDLFSTISLKSGNCKDHLCPKNEQLIETFCADLHCTKTMQHSMKQYIRYLTLSEIDYVSIIHNMYEQKLLPCKDKKEGKQRFEEFKRKLF